MKKVFLLTFLWLTFLVVSEGMGQRLFVSPTIFGNSGHPQHAVFGDNVRVQPFGNFYTNGAQVLQITGNDNIGIHGEPMLSFVQRQNNRYAGQIYWARPDYTTGDKRMAIISSHYNTSTKGGKLRFLTRENQNSGAQLRMVINEKGRVGINTGSPSAMLHIVEPANTGMSTLVVEAKANSNPNIIFSSESNWKWNIVNKYNQDHDLVFDGRVGNWSEVMRLKRTGQVSIGTRNIPAMSASDGSPYRFFVNGGGLFNEVKVEQDWADYVLCADHQRITLAQEAKFIQANGHLSGFESAEMMDGYINLGDVTLRQQIKIEEMRLDQIESDQTIRQQAAEIDDLKSTLEVVLKRLEALEN